MTVIHAQVVLPRAGGMPQDAAINTFTFQGSATPDDMAASAAPLLEAFYNDGTGDDDPVCSHLNRTRSRATNASTMRFYDITAHLGGSDAGPPVLVHEWTLGSNSGTDALPEEVALVLSFHGVDDTIPEFGPGTRPRSRHRGRVYLGPLLYHVTAGGIGDPITPDTSMVASWVNAGTELIAAAGSTLAWAVWSRRNAAAYNVVGGWVDNAFDTIRGRGFEPTSRTDYPPPV